MKRSFFIRIIALAASIALLTGALVVAAVAGSPYEVLKKSVLNFDSMTSHSMSLVTSATLNGVPLISEKQYNEYVAGIYSYSTSDGYVCYKTDAGTLSFYNDESYAHFYKYGSNVFVSYDSPFNIFGIDNEQNPKYKRLIEMAADLIVGDLKNNISMSQTGDIRHISGTLTANQIPELYNAAFDLLMAENGSYIYVASEYDLSTLDIDNMTIEYKNTFVLDAKIHEDVTRCSLNPSDFANYSSPQLYADMQNGELVDNILYLDGIYYEIWHENILSQKETPLDEAAYNAYPKSEGQLPPVSSARITYIHGEVDVDGKGIIRSVYADVSIALTDIFGNAHELDVNISAEVNEISGVANPRYERIMKAVAAYAPENDQYYDVSFTLDENDNPIIANVYDGWSSSFSNTMPGATVVIEENHDGVSESFVIDGSDFPSDMPTPMPYPTDDFNAWLEQRVAEMAADPIYFGVDAGTLEIIARNEWTALYDEMA